MELSVVIPTHNPDPGRLQRTLLALRGQTLASDRWETILINNGSERFPKADWFAGCAPANFRIIEEPLLGLTHARKRGFAVAKGAFSVLVDDDNVLAADYLATTLALFAEHPRVGLLAGKSLPDFEVPAPEWTREFHALLALRDLGDRPLLSNGLHPAGAVRNEYPAFAPIGAGMALRRTAWEDWLKARETRAGPGDRRGGDLASSGDNDIVLCAMRAGWEVGYFPELLLTHLIPLARLDASYLARLNHGIQKSWMQVLTLHDANPWSPLTPFGAALRKFKAWLTQRPWRSSAARVRWCGTCGHFEGRVPQ
jgi:glycosyltransferase involved in cell wall biosynthesis